MKKNSFVEGTLIASCSIVFIKLLGALYVIPFYSIIGEEGGALYSYAYNIYNLFLNISVAGIPVAISKIISEYNALEMYEAKERAFRISKKIVFIISLLCFLILFCFSKEFAYLIIGNIEGGNNIEDISFVIKCVSLCLLIIPFLSVSKGYLQGHKYVAPTSISQIIEQLVRIFVILFGSFITIKVLNKSVSVGVGIAVLGAFVGGLVAYLYLKIRINKKDLKVLIKTSKDDVSDRKIIKKIFMYAVPLIIISIVTNIYNITDLTLIIRALSMIGYSMEYSEVVSSIISTWGSKICMLITALSTGLSINLIPIIISKFVKNDIVGANKKFIQSINIIFVIALPLSILLSVFSNSIYTLFYGYNEIGFAILKYLPFTAFMSSLHVIMNSFLQGINKYRIIYFNTILGFFINAILDIPLIILFDKFGLYPYYGAITATIIGYLISIIIVVVYLRRKLNFRFQNTTINKMFLPLVTFILSLLTLKYFIKSNYTNRIIQLPILLMVFLICGGLYLFMIYKNKTIECIFGKRIINKIIKSK